MVYPFLDHAPFLTAAAVIPAAAPPACGLTSGRTQTRAVGPANTHVHMHTNPQSMVNLGKNIVECVAMVTDSHIT